MLKRGTEEARPGSEELKCGVDLITASACGVRGSVHQISMSEGLAPAALFTSQPSTLQITTQCILIPPRVMSDSSGSPSGPLLARLRAHLRSADQLASTLLASQAPNKRKHSSEPASGERKWTALAAVSDKPIKWRKLRRLAVSEYGVGEEEPAVWAVRDEGPVGGVAGVKGLVELMRRTVDGGKGVRRMSDVMEMSELVVVLRGWLIGQERQVASR